MKTIIYKIISLLSFSLFTFSFGALATTEPPPENIEPETKLTARVYCFYVPKAYESAKPAEQIKAATYLKLVRGSDSAKVPAIYRNNNFIVSEEEYYKLFEECQAFVHDKGNMLDLKGTDAAYFETLTHFYRLAIDKFKIGDLDKEDLSMSRALNKAGFSAEELKKIDEVLDNNQALINDISTKLAGTSLTNEILSGLKNIYDSDHVTTALSVAGFLAAVWFGPAALSAGVELLYPLVYQALWGVPSKFGLSYWFIYYPGKMHAMNFAFTNSAQIFKLAGIALGGGYKLYKAVSDRLSKPEIKGELENLSKSIVAK